MFLACVKGKSVLISDPRYAEHAAVMAQKAKCRFVVFDADFKKKFGEKLQGRFGIEDSVTVAQLKRWKKTFPQVRFVSKSLVVEEFRRQKTEMEMDKIRKAQAHVDKLLLPFLKSKLKAGITEKTLAFWLEHAIRGEGEFDLSFASVVAFGENSAIPHHQPGERKLKKGDLILIDCGAKYEGYCSDMTRCFGFDKVAPEIQNQYDLLLQAQEMSLAQYKVGAKTKDLDLFCRAQLGHQEKYFVHSLGHGVGLEVHEGASISHKSKQALRANEVVTCEPGIYYPGKFGIRIEDLVLVKEKGMEILSKTPKKNIYIL